VVLRHFVRDFLGYPELIGSSRQVGEDFYTQCDVRAKAVYLFTATTGLRKGEILGLTGDKIKPKLRAVIPKHFTRKKRSGITFYNAEAEEWLEKYHRERDGSRVFVVSDRQWRRIWHNASEGNGMRITGQVLRKWFDTEMGELGVPDRYVDIFQGRAPRTVLARHYTGKGLERLKRIYEKAGLQALS
jgi:intergrase/recombinase